jgi:hypothetical protein
LPRSNAPENAVLGFLVEESRTRGARTKIWADNSLNFKRFYIKFFSVAFSCLSPPEALASSWVFSGFTWEGHANFRAQGRPRAGSGRRAGFGLWRGVWGAGSGVMEEMRTIWRAFPVERPPPLEHLLTASSDRERNFLGAASYGGENNEKCIVRFYRFIDIFEFRLFEKQCDEAESRRYFSARRVRLRRQRANAARIVDNRERQQKQDLCSESAVFQRLRNKEL